MRPVLSLRSDLRSHRLDNELLVYDPASEQVHLLDSTTARVVQLIEEGTDSDEIIRTLNEDCAAGRGEDLLSLTLAELGSAGLLEVTEQAPAMQETTRRQMVQRMAAAGAAMLIPGIVTLAPQSAGAQGSQLPNGSACTSSVQCASGCCASNSSGSCLNNSCSPTSCTNCRP